MKRRAVLALLAPFSVGPDSAGAAVPLATPPLKPFLRISGHIGLANATVPDASVAGEKVFDFSETAFLALPATAITTATSWTPRSRFTGPLLQTVMQRAGVQGGTLVFGTLNDYSAAIPWSDLVRYGVILAHSQDGRRLSNKRWGPLWAMYPRDRYPDELSGPVAESRFIWQVNSIEVRA